MRSPTLAGLRTTKGCKTPGGPRRLLAEAHSIRAENNLPPPGSCCTSSRVILWRNGTMVQCLGNVVLDAVVVFPTLRIQTRSQSMAWGGQRRTVQVDLVQARPGLERGGALRWGWPGQPPAGGISDCLHETSVTQFITRTTRHLSGINKTQRSASQTARQPRSSSLTSLNTPPLCNGTKVVHTIGARARGGDTRSFRRPLALISG